MVEGCVRGVVWLRRSKLGRLEEMRALLVSYRDEKQERRRKKERRRLLFKVIRAIYLCLIAQTAKDRILLMLEQFGRTWESHSRP